MKKICSKTTMRRLFCIFFACVITVSSVWFGSIPADSADSKLTDAKVQSYEDQLAKMEAEQKQILAKLSKLQKEENSLLVYKQELDNYMEMTARKIDAAQKLLDELEVQICDNRQAIEETEAEHARVYQQFLDMMAIAQEEGNASYIGLILGSDSLGEFLSRVERVSSMLEYNKTIMQSLDRTEEELVEQKASLEEKIRIQNDTMELLKADEADYAAKSDEAIQQMKTLDQNQAAAQKLYYENKAMEDKLNKELEEYLAELQRKNQAKMESGDFQWPIDLNVQQYLSSAYGWRKLYGVWDFHRGWDIACYLGNDIHAAKSGTVVIAEYHYSYGNYVVIDHGDGVSTVYAHASKLLVSKGDKVKKGDVIAKVGTSGNSTGYHLHFEFRLNGKYTDPFNYIKNPPISVPASRYEKK